MTEQRDVLARHPLPWSAGRNQVDHDHWRVTDADGDHVVTVVEDGGTGTGVAVILALAAEHHERIERDRDCVVIERRAPMVAVSVPGVAVTTIGADTMGEFPDSKRAGAGHGRRDAMLVRALLADALERVDAQLAPTVRVEARPTPEAVQLAARHLDTEVEAAHLTGPTASAVRTVLRELMTR